ncbi:hypothetical protein [Lacticaseibacillus mingshuiensis]|uniref:Uncharacterized protein n=1 Tax=Lacticaseibacillus mingshuiensis TaxID=2799574 RepID=A0ABW4CFE1_9LACO|nr:hypothetical protein [Lacticaseibacillus mingshuiensis]
MKDLLAKTKEFFASEIGLLIATIVFAPLGIYLVWKNQKFTKNGRIIFSAVATLVFLIGIGTINSNSVKSKSYDHLNATYKKLVAKEKGTATDYRELKSDYNKLDSEYNDLQTENNDYHTKMEPYEKLSDADAKKRQNDAAAADKVNELLQDLPSVGTLASKDEASLKKTRTMYNSLTADQKKLVNVTHLSELESALPGVKKKEAAAAAAAKKKKEEAAAAAKAKAAAAAAAKAKAAEEERRGYETGITYDQLARTPDSYMGKKVKFYGEVVQIMEDGDSVQARLAVNGDYDNMLLCDWTSSTVSSRILENDQITIFGVSAGLITYESTMGGDITIPSVAVDKISH